jgi:A/G-specific adenine glycosylase
MDTITQFKDFIWHFYHQNKRDFAWRNTNNPYHILVSEIMLQQTQTHRVIAKYEEFIAAFPTIESLAHAQLRDVLSVWQGLGYYRRARFLHQLAQKVVDEYAGILPHDPQLLQTLPGIGPNTAGSICAFAFNRLTVFIETNIRAVFIHSFFSDKPQVSDKEILPLVAATVDQENPREWYYALMDYGVFLKSHTTNPSRKSAHYTKQSKFEGSDRQLRAKILKLMVNAGSLAHHDILQCIRQDDDRVAKMLAQLVAEGFIKVINGVYLV